MREQELRGQEASENELPYVAPEVLIGQSLGRRPTCSRGVLAYQMTCEVLPFRARSLPELIGQMLQRRPAAPSTLNPDVPPSASEALLRALSSDPGFALCRHPRVRGRARRRNRLALPARSCCSRSFTSLWLSATMTRRSPGSRKLGFTLIEDAYQARAGQALGAGRASGLERHRAPARPCRDAGAGGLHRQPDRRPRFPVPRRPRFLAAITRPCWPKGIRFVRPQDEPYGTVAVSRISTATLGPDRAPRVTDSDRYLQLTVVVTGGDGCPCRVCAMNFTVTAVAVSVSRSRN